MSDCISKAQVLYCRTLSVQVTSDLGPNSDTRQHSPAQTPFRDYCPITPLGPSRLYFSSLFGPWFMESIRVNLKSAEAEFEQVPLAHSPGRLLYHTERARFSGPALPTLLPVGL